jgi:hypothetical protein
MIVCVLLIWAGLGVLLVEGIERILRPQDVPSCLAFRKSSSDDLSLCEMQGIA